MIRQGQLVLVFIIIYMFCFFTLFVEQYTYDSIKEEKENIEQALLDALEASAMEFTKVIHDSEDNKTHLLEETFFDTLHIAFDIVDDVTKKNQFAMYVPLLLLVESDGVYYCYVDEKKNGKITELEHIWTEKEYFVLPEEYNAELKSLHMISIIEEKVEELISRHNYIAQQYGFSYTFTVPKFVKYTLERNEFPIICVVFQGWPLFILGNLTYENCLATSGYLQEKERYIVEFSKELEHPENIFHRTDCSEISYESDNFSVEQFTEIEAIKKCGAYPCPKCCKY